MADSFRMDMSGDKSYREDALDASMEVFDENTRSAAVVKACEHARRDARAKERAISYLLEHVPPEHVAPVIERLATPQLPIAARVRYESNLDTTRTEIELGDTE